MGTATVAEAEPTIASFLKVGLRLQGRGWQGVGVVLKFLE